MKTIGAELIRVASGAVWITMVPAAATSQQHGYVHAGVVTSLLDSAGVSTTCRLVRTGRRHRA